LGGLKTKTGTRFVGTGGRGRKMQGGWSQANRAETQESTCLPTRGKQKRKKSGGDERKKLRKEVQKGESLEELTERNHLTKKKKEGAFFDRTEQGKKVGKNGERGGWMTTKSIAGE